MMGKSKLALAMVVVSAAICASAASRNNEIRIKVLDSETRSANLGGNGVPVNCDNVNFDAYCNHSKDAIVTNTLQVQEDNGKTYRIVCTVETRYSRCVPLPKGSSYDARRDKRGVTVYYVDDRGRVRSQLYAVVAGDLKAFDGAATAPVPQSDNAADGTAELPPAGEREPADPQQTVKCSFSSSPSGAEVLVDGRFAGSTPSVIGVTTGAHVVVMSMAGFSQWKRELTVTPGSELTVNAVLEKVQ